MFAKQQRLMAILAVVLAALVAIIVWVKPPEGEDDDDGKEQPVAAWDGLQREDIQGLRITRKGGESIVLEKAEGRWSMVAPMETRADASRVDAMVGRLAGLKIKGSIETSDAAVFGLGDPPEVRLVGRKADGQEIILDIGTDTPVGYGTYVRIGGQGPVRVATGKVREDFTRAVDDYRNHEVWSFAASDVERIRWRPTPGAVPRPDPEAEGAGGAVPPPSPEATPAPSPWNRELVKNAHGWWLGEGGPRADGEKVDAWLRQARDLRIETFSPETGSGTVEGGEILIVAAGAEHRIRIGGPEAGGYVATVPLVDKPVRLTQGVADLAGRTPESFLSGNLLPVARFSVDRVAVTLGERTWTSEKKEGVWSEPATNAFLDALEDARVSRDAALSGSDPLTWGRIELAEGTSRKEVLQMGPRREEGNHVAKDEAGGPPFLVPADAIEALEGAWLGRTPEAEGGTEPPPDLGDLQVSP